jgi:hypothetical protein
MKASAARIANATTGLSTTRRSKSGRGGLTLRPCASVLGARPSRRGNALTLGALPRSSKRSMSRLNTVCGNPSAHQAPSIISAIGTGSHSASPRPPASR